MSPGLPGLAISYLLYAILGLRKADGPGRPGLQLSRVQASSLLALSGLVAMAALAWWKRADAAILVFTTQPILLAGVICALAFVRRRRRPKERAAAPPLLARLRATAYWGRYADND